MPTIDKATVKWMIEQLDHAYVLGRIAGAEKEPDICWYVRVVRDRLLSAAITDLNVEAVSASELTDAREAKQSEA